MTYLVSTLPLIRLPVALLGRPNIALASSGPSAFVDAGGTDEPPS